MILSKRSGNAPWRAMAAVLLSSLLLGTAIAATTDIANAPLFTSSSTAVKPNIMYVLDDSGSMAWDFLPDDANFSTTKYGKLASQCNGVAYNPNITYELPVDSTGTSASPGSLTFITPNPSTQTSTPRTLSAITSMPTSATGTLNVTVTAGSRQSSWYSTGATVTVYNTGDSARYMVGTVNSWNTTSGSLVINLAGGMVVGSGAMASPVVANGQPVSATYYVYSGSQKKLGYTYTSGGVITSSTFYRECNSTIGSSPGSSVFTPVTVTSNSAEAQNYANWYQYYRTRIDMMQSSISLAFRPLDSRYRIGFSTISQTTAVQGTNFLDIRDFDATQKSAFYTAVNAATPGNSTPLRGALSKAGQYYAVKARGQTVDPVQYSCQRNFTILSTDGYWNTGDESSSAPKYGPYQLNNTTNVGEQDAYPTRRPMFDGSTVQATTTETWTATAVTTTTTTTTQTAVTTSMSSTTANVPTTGYERYSYTLYSKQAVSSISRPRNTSPYLVTISTSSAHGLTTGQTVVVGYSGGSATGYTGSVTITVVDANTFTYPSTSGSRPSNPPGSASDYTVALSGAETCTAGRGVVMQQRQTQDLLTSTTSSTTNSTTTVSILTAVRTQTDTTPYSRVTVSINGSLVSDTGPVQGTLQSTPITTTSSFSLPSTTATAPGNGGVATSYTGWVNSGDPTQKAGTCLALPSPNPSNPATIAPTTTAFTTTAGPTTTGPIVTSGAPSSLVSGPVPSESSHVTRTSSVTSNGTSDTLADIAAYYYNTDLRSSALSNCTGALGSDVCANNVPGSTSDAAHSYGDSASWQHMTTFTLGLGVSGLLNYDPNYLTQRAGDFFDITSGAKNWPVPGPTMGPENVDDLWHAAVNGHGQYFSAGDPEALSLSLSTALQSIKATTGAAAAASTSSLQPVQGDNDVYVAQFTSVKWIGDLLSYKIDPATGSISNTVTWSAKTQLDAMTPSSRNIYYPNPTGGSTLRAFNYVNLAADSYASYFDGFCSKPGLGGASSPGQCGTLSASDTTAANTGANLVAFLRGDQTMAYYRARESALGDIINASPVFVGKPSFKYLENDYPSFASSNAARTAVVLVASNDGMLHAFDRVTGNERWAYLPSFVLPNLYKLADTSYSNNHSYYVDGSPQMGDIFVGGQWKTIVVGGMGAGGRGYFALDVTNPASPTLLWEFTNTNLGLTFGNPVITKRDNGTWVVAFASGYNNVGPGDGNGHLFILNAATGAILNDISTYTTGTTPAGTTASPSGLAKINVWIDSDTNNLARRFYGGDLLGNVWRFDIDNLVQPFQSALLLAQLRDSSGTPQSIMVKPPLGQVTYNGVNYPVVYAATGRYLGLSDLANTSVQSIYAIKDPLTATSYGDVHASTSFVGQTLSAATDASGNPTRTVAANPVDWGTKAGWKADFPGAGERVSVNPQLILNTLYVGTNVPSSDACTVGGSSFLYKLDFTTGSTVTGESYVGTYVGNVLIEGLTTVQLGTSSSTVPGSIVTIVTRSDATLQTNVGAPPSLASGLRRTSWRELAE